MHIRTLFASATAGVFLAGVCAATLPAADAATAPSAVAAGTVVAWGDSSVATETAVPDDLTAPVVDIAANSGSTVAVMADGHIRVWGNATSPVVQYAPTDVTDAAAVVLDTSAALVLNHDGTVTGWGYGADFTPPDGLHAKAIAVGAGTAYAVTTDGTLVTWGTPVTLPDSVASLTDLVDVSVGGAGGLALRANGTAVAWGMSLPDMGDPFNTLPADIGDHKIVQIAAAGFSDGVLLDDGTVRVWGLGLTQETFPGKTVTSLKLAGGIAAVTLKDASGNPSVALWSTGIYPDVTDPTHIAALDGEPVSTIGLADNHVDVVVTSFRETAKPTVAGTPMVGQTLTATPATYSLDPDAPATGQWYAGSDPIPNQTGTTLTLDDTLVGKSISYHSSATRGDDTVDSVSDAIGPVVDKATAAVGLSVAKGTYGKSSTVSVNVPGASGNVGLSVDGKSVGTKALAGGKASFTLAKTTKPGSHPVVASYAGDSSYKAATKSATLVVGKGATSVPTMKLKASAKKAGTVTATVNTAAGLVKATGKAQLVLKKGKSTKKVNLTVKNGKATGKLPKLPKGTWKATLTYQGNTYYLSAKSKTVTVKSK